MRSVNLITSALLLLGLALQASTKAAVPVTQAPLEQLLLHPEFSAPATTVSLNDSRISSATAGLIQNIPVRVGDRVQDGALLAELDCRSNRIFARQAAAALESARARLTLAQRQFKRSKALRKTHNVSEEIINQREADLNSARADLAASTAALEQRRLDVQRCRILAPFDGVVMARLASEGEWIAPGQPLLRLLDIQRLEVSAQIALDLVPDLRQARRLELRSAGNSHPLTLKSIIPAVDPLGRNQEARLLFQGTPPLVGSSGRLTWQTTQPYLPADLPQRRGDKLGVFINQDGIARFHPLPGALEGQPAPCNLPPGSLLILDGRHGLQDGDPVTPGT